ncbi:adhesion G protein-coupled receptor B1-like [Lampetra fluviatilis]
MTTLAPAAPSDVWLHTNCARPRSAAAFGGRRLLPAKWQPHPAPTTPPVGDGGGAALRSDALPADPVRLALRLAQLTAAAAAAATTAAAATETAAAVAAATREAAAAAVAGGGGGRHGRGGRPLYGGELLATVGLLRAALARLGAGRPSERDLQAFLQVLNNLLLDENKEVWEDAQKLSPIAADLLSLVVELMHAAARSMKPFHNPYHCLDNFVIGLYKFPLFRAESDVSFPMRARRGMASWARNTQDKIHISHRSLSAMATGSEAPAVIGTVLFRNLSYIFPTGRGSAVINSRIFAVTVRPTPSAVTAPVEIEFTHLSNETDNVCVVWDPKMTTTSAGLGTTSGGRAASGNAAGSAAWASGLAAGADHGARIGSSAGRGGGWSARGCAPVAARPGRTRCRCHSLDAAFAILARREADSLDMDQASTLSLTLVVGCTVSSLALLCLIVVYALYWRVVRSERAVILINLCISIISSNGLILLAQTLMQQRVCLAGCVEGPPGVPVGPCGSLCDPV